jgi:4-amino-4-deoxy-L-arabinose transferase-like glycosyltransferase
MALLLLGGAALRLFGLNNLSPPGLAHDEVAHWLINRDILAGEHAIYFSEAYGHEAAFHYLQAIFMAALGDHALALRLPAAFCGLLLVAVAFALVRRLFGWRVALLAAAWLAVLFYPVFYSRLGLRAIALPLLSALSAAAWWAGWQNPAPFRTARRGLLGSTTWLALAGLFAGLSFHTYMAARALPIFYGLFALYLALFHRPALRRHWRGVALFWIIYILVAGPLVYYLLAHPGAEVRIGEVDAPLRALKAGDPGPALANSLRIFGMFGWRGDPLWRQNVAHRPVFEPATALFFYIGWVLALYRWRDSRYAFLLLWLLASALPSVVTIDAPSSIRIVNSLSLLTAFPAIAIHSLTGLSTESPHLSTDFGKKWGIWVTGILLLWAIGWTLWATFRLWPANEEVQFVWQQALTEASAFLDNSPENGPVAIGGWTPESMDPPTIELSLRREDLVLRFFDPGRALIIPAPGSGPARIVRPAILPLEPALEAALTNQGVAGRPIASFVLYEAPLLVWHPAIPNDTAFGDELVFLGHDALAPCTAEGAPADVCRLELLTYWQVERPAGGERRIFLHLVDEEGNLIAQDDGLGAPAAYWQPGDVILQRHSLIVPGGSRSYSLRLGVYDPGSGARLMTGAGKDSVLLPPFSGLPRS